MNFIKEVKNDKGFTLVELMVVVGIIGILSAVAIPKFQTYQAKSKTSEAKIHLAAIYSAEVSLMSDYDNYGTCLAYAGYSGPGTNNYYAVGFNTANNGNAAVVTNGGAGCVTADTRAWPAAKSVGGVSATVANVQALGGTVNAAGDEFTVFAQGAIAGSHVLFTGGTALTRASQWSVDQDKTFTEGFRGY